ncbi:unnamed protein product, partial [marine sediment metagenome]
MTDKRLLSPEEIKALLPVKDGYTYYESFGEAVAKNQDEISYKAGDTDGYFRGFNNGMRQGQLASTEEEREKIFQRIEYQLMKEGKDKLSIYREVWQVLK